jgi:hypothetical protein
MNLNRTTHRTLATLIAVLGAAAFSAPVCAQDESGVQYADPNGFFTVTLPASWAIHPYPNRNPRGRSYALNAVDPSGASFNVWVFPGVQSGDAALGQLRAMLAGDRMNWHEQPPANSGGRQYRQFFGDTTNPNGAVIDVVVLVHSFAGGSVIVSFEAGKGNLVPALPLLRQVFNTFDPGA